MIVEVRVESRDSIIPTFRLPATPVRVTETMVGRGGLESPTAALERLERYADQSAEFNVTDREAGVMK